MRNNLRPGSNATKKTLREYIVLLESVVTQLRRDIKILEKQLSEARLGVPK